MFRQRQKSKIKTTITKTIHIPDMNKEKFCELYDKYRATRNTADKYRLWKYIKEILHLKQDTEVINDFPNFSNSIKIVFFSALEPAIQYEVEQR